MAENKSNPLPIAQHFLSTRKLTEALLANLSEGDAVIQSMDDASPAKWHAAHTTWFFESFILRDHVPGYRLFNAQWPFLFNSYYEAEGARIGRGNRGMLSRPTLVQILEWRAAVDEAMLALIERTDFSENRALFDLVELGIAHEEQHVELLLTDIKHAFFSNPMAPAMWREPVKKSSAPFGQPLEGWSSHQGDIHLTGNSGDEFSFDNERPAHRSLLVPFKLSRCLVSNGDWQEFIADGGYQKPALWLSDGWSWVNRKAISCPLYWRDEAHFTHQGWQLRDPEAPVSHVSFYEADAFAAWAGARLPTEFEWEAAATDHSCDAGNQLDGDEPPLPIGTSSLFGDCWQFTSSPYLPYPGFRPAKGAVGEYNGKFMSGQNVLKGASCATVRHHSRDSYRNFFYPQQRWQFTGLRLAKDDF